jgi:hypothetical protein
MALLFADSFDLYATADITRKWTTHSEATIGAYGRNSTNGLQIYTGTTSYVMKTFSANTNDCIMGVGFKPVSTTVNDSEFLAIMDTGTTQVSVNCTASGTVRVYRSTSAGTLLGTASVALSFGTYYYVELRTKIHNTLGTIDLYVNGTNVLSLTDQDTQMTALAQWTTAVVGIVNSVGGFGNTTMWNFDDFYLADSSGAVNNTVLGPIRVAAVLPDGNGATTNFSPSAGTNYQNVDETAPDSDTSYNTETTPGELDLYTFAALGLTGTVRGVQTNLCVRSNGGGAETIAPMWRIDSGGGPVNYTGTTVSLTTSYAYSLQVYETSPATSTAWTVSEIDGAESGIKLVS